MHLALLGQTHQGRPLGNQRIFGRKNRHRVCFFFLAPFKQTSPPNGLFMALVPKTMCLKEKKNRFFFWAEVGNGRGFSFVGKFTFFKMEFSHGQLGFCEFVKG